MAIKVEVHSYDDRGDPAPPHNYRVEVTVAGVMFIPAYGAYTSKVGAEMLKLKVEEALKDNG